MCVYMFIISAVLMIWITLARVSALQLRLQPLPRTMAHRESHEAFPKQVDGAKTSRFLSRHPSFAADAAANVAARFASRELKPTEILDGTFLKYLARVHCQAFQELLPDGFLAPNRSVSWGSGCTGSASDLVIISMMEAAYREYGVSDLRFDYRFSCEIEKTKRSFIQQMHDHWAPNSDACLFTDVLHLGQQTCQCVVHRKKCPVPSVDVLSFCASCKDFSKMRGDRTLALASDASIGGSAQTFLGLKRYMDAHRPTIVIFENVDSIDESVPNFDKTNADILLSEFASRGYEVQRCTLNTKDFGIPQNRIRAYFIAVLVNGNPSLTFETRGIDAAFWETRSLIKVCVRQAPCASRLLMEDSDPALEEELARRRGAKSARQAYAMHKSMASGSAQGVSWATLSAPDELERSPWFNLLSAQQRDCLLYSLKTNPAALLFRDIEPTIHRVRISKIIESKSGGDTRHIAMTMLPKQIIMVFNQVARPRLLLGYEAMVFQGFPMALMSSAIRSSKECLLKDLAGNMVSLPVMLAVTMATISSMPWRQGACASASQADVADEDDVNAALAAFRLAVGKRCFDAESEGQRYCHMSRPLANVGC